MRVRQARCGTCGRPVGVGRAIVREFGGGGRFHEECLPVALEAPTMHDSGRPRPASQQRAEAPQNGFTGAVSTRTNRRLTLKGEQS